MKPRIEEDVGEITERYRKSKDKPVERGERREERADLPYSSTLPPLLDSSDSELLIG